MSSSTEMVEQEHQISYDGGEATPESLMKVEPGQPQRGLEIAVPEKLWREKRQIMFSRGSELVFHPLYPQPNTTVFSLQGFDPCSPFEDYVENFSMSRSQLLVSSPLVSSDGTLPLLWNSFQCDTSSNSSNSQSLVVSELKQQTWEPQALLPFQKHEFQLQISKVMNHASLPLHSVSGAGLQMELELPSNQSHYGIVDASYCAVQPITMDQIAVMNHPWPSQMDPGQIQNFTVLKPTPFSCSNNGTLMINGTQEGKNTDWSIDDALSLNNIGVNLGSNYFTVKRIGSSEVDVARPIDNNTLNLACLPSVCSNDWSPKTTRHFSNMNAPKRQKKTKEGAWSNGSATSSESLAFYNFMELPYNDFAADRDAIANLRKRSWEVTDVVDVDLKL